MIRQVLKSARLIFEIALVVGIVLLIYWWNPMGIFGGKLKLVPTANLSVQIREMGELITAEYYGEVISSINETIMDDLEDQGINDQTNVVFYELEEMLAQLRYFQSLDDSLKLKIISRDDTQLSRRETRRLLSDRVSRSNILDRLIFLGEWEDFQLLPLHGEVLAFLFEKSKGKNQSIRASLNENQTRETLFYLYERPSDTWQDQNEFIAAYYQRKINQLPKREQSKRLAMIGRGTVKAGFDLSNLSHNMFYINETSGELHFFGLAPKILNSDINPWFIPEKGVAGFDILTYNGKVNFKDAKKVKEYAVQKLETNAQKAGILKDAEIYGGESLRHLFSLMTGKEIKKVFFHHDELIQYTQQIIKDRFINYDEGVLFEELISDEMETIDSLQNARENRFNNQQLAQEKWRTLTKMVSDVQQFPFENDGSRFGYFSTWMYGIAQSGVIDREIQDSLKNLRHALKSKNILSDSLAVLWTGADSLWLMEQFNQSLNLLIANQIPVGELSEIKFSRDAIDSDTIQSLNAQLVQQGIDSLVYEYISSTKENSTFLTDMLFPFQYSGELWEKVETGRFVTLEMGNKESFPHENKLLVYTSEGAVKMRELNLTLRDITHPAVYKKLAGQKLLWLIKDQLCIILDALDLENELAKKTESKGLTAEQRSELADFISHIIHVQETNSTLGPVTRANRWITGKFQDKRSLKERFGRFL